MPPRVIFDNSAILNGLTPVPQRGSIIWHWMQTEAVQDIRCKMSPEDSQ